MSELANNLKKQGAKKKNSNTKGMFIAIVVLFVVACSFSYAIGVQQKANRTPASMAAIDTNNQFEQGFNTSRQDGNEYYGNKQYGHESGEQEQYRGIDNPYGHRKGHEGHHGFNEAQSGNMSSSQNYSAEPQRCCATGKTGTCHS